MSRLRTEFARTMTSALRAQADFAVFVGESDRVIRVGADDRAEPRDPADLLLGRIGEMDDDGAVVGAGVLRHQRLDNAEDDVEAEVAVDMDVELIAGVPVEARALFQFVRRDDPFAVMAVEIAVLHLHELGDDRAVGEELDLPGEEHQLLAGPAGETAICSSVA
jgi:hypothetical protein